MSINSLFCLFFLSELEKITANNDKSKKGPEYEGDNRVGAVKEVRR